MGTEPSLADFTSPSLIQPALQGREVVSVLHELCGVLHQAGRVLELLPFYNAALNREFLSSTAMENGMACPHARPRRQGQLTFALGRSSEPLDWGSRGVVPVTLVFLSAIPATHSGDSLRLVGGLSRLSRSPALLERLRQAPDADAMHAILANVSLKPLNAFPKPGSATDPP